MSTRNLHDFADVFVVSSDDLGHTSLVTHQIDTGSSHPIRQPARRLPLHKRAEADTLLKDMLKKGVIMRLCIVLQRLCDAGLKLSPKKCILLQQSVPFLGHVVSDHGVSTDPKKIEAVRTWPFPRAAKDVKSFLGLCSYYRCFVRGFADIARPLYRLNEGQREFGGPACEDAFPG